MKITALAALAALTASSAMAGMVQECQGFDPLKNPEKCTWVEVPRDPSGMARALETEESKQHKAKRNAARWAEFQKQMGISD